VANWVQAEVDLGPKNGDPLFVIRRSPFVRPIFLPEYVNGNVPPAATERARRVQISGEAVREFTVENGDRYMALAFPVRHTGSEEVVGVLEVLREATYIDVAMKEAILRMIATLVLMAAGLGVVVALFVRRAVSRPLRRMLREI